MEENKAAYTTIDEYIALFEPEVQQKLQALRAVIKEAAPDAQEKISWQMPTFTLHGNLVHFAANKKHIGLYPGASGVESFLPKLAAYKTSKGAIQFPMDKPMPFELITEIVQFRAAQNIEEANKKQTQKKK